MPIPVAVLVVLVITFKIITIIRLSGGLVMLAKWQVNEIISLCCH